MNQAILETLQLLVSQVEQAEHQHAMVVQKLNFQQLKSKQLQIEVDALRKIVSEPDAPLSYADDPITLRKIIIMLMETFAHSDTYSFCPTIRTATHAAKLEVKQTYNGIFQVTNLGE